MQLMYWLIAIAVAAGAAWWVWRADRRRAVPYPWLTAGLRGLVVLAALLLVLIPDIIIDRHVTEQPVIVLLQDNSSSAGVALGADTATYRRNMNALTERLSKDYRVVQWGFGDGVQPDTLFRYDRPATDISAAMTRAEELYGMQNLGGVILATDGRFNQGVHPAYRSEGGRYALYTVGLGDSTREKDLRIARTYANRTAMLNSTFEVRADIVAELCRGYDNSAVLKEGDEVLASVPVSIGNDRFDRSVAFVVKGTKTGLHHYTISLADAGSEKNIANNRRDVFVEVVDEKKKILIAAAAPHPDVNALKEALGDLQSYEVTVCTGETFPRSVEGYDALILHGLPSARFRIAPDLEAAKKPMWFVLTAQTDILAMNGLKGLTHTGVAAAPGHEMAATFHQQFNAFTVPQRTQVVADKMPPLTSYTGNIIAAPGSNVFFTQRTTAGVMPAWCMQQGTVPTAVLAGEGIWRWRLYEYRHFDEHNVIDEGIRQTVAFLCANTGKQPLSVSMPRRIWSDQEPISLNAILLNANNEPVNTADVQLTITDSAGRKQEYSFERSGTGYNINIGIRAGGNYTYSARTTFNNKELKASGAFVVESIPLEAMETGADYAMLYNLARSHGGAFVPSAGVAALYDSIRANKAITPVIRTNTETVPLVERKWYFVIILLVAVAEWLLRKYWLAQ